MNKKSKIKIKLRKAISFYRNIIRNKSNFNIPFYKKLYYNCKGFTSDQIVLFDLNKDNYKNFITEVDRWETRYINSDFKEILDNKLLFYNYFKRDLKIPKVLGYIVNGYFYNIDGENLNQKLIVEIVKKEKKFLIKPLNAGGGSGIHLVEYKNEKLYFDNERIDFKRLIDLLLKYDNYILSKFIKQNKYSSEIFENTVNTIRIISYFDNKNNKIEIANATHRFGSSKSSIVDNVCSGGLFADVCVKTGVLSHAYSYNSTEKIKRHPVTSKKIEGIKIPKWAEITEYVKEKGKKYPYLPYMAWDIVLDENNKIVVIEINASSGLTLIQMYRGYKNTGLDWFFKSKNVY